MLHRLKRITRDEHIFQTYYQSYSYKRFVNKWSIMRMSSEPHSPK